MIQWIPETDLRFWFTIYLYLNSSNCAKFLVTVFNYCVSRCVYLSCTSSSTYSLTLNEFLSYFTYDRIYLSFKIYGSFLTVPCIVKFISKTQLPSILEHVSNTDLQPNSWRVCDQCYGIAVDCSTVGVFTYILGSYPVNTEQKYAVLVMKHFTTNLMIYMTASRREYHALWCFFPIYIISKSWQLQGFYHMFLFYLELICYNWWTFQWKFNIWSRCAW